MTLSGWVVVVVITETAGRTMYLEHLKLFVIIIVKLLYTVMQMIIR